MKMISERFRTLSRNKRKELIPVDEYKRVSSDFTGSTFSPIIVSDYTMEITETGYNSRLADTSTHIREYKC